LLVRFMGKIVTSNCIIFTLCAWSWSWSWSSSCSRQSVDQFVWVSGLPLGPLTTFYLALLSSSDNYLILLSKASSQTRKRVCNLQCNHSQSVRTSQEIHFVSATDPTQSLRTNNHTLPSHLRLCSVSVASYDSQGLRWRYSNPPPHGALCMFHRNFFTAYFPVTCS
jgi:hypothetical protein